MVGAEFLDYLSKLQIASYVGVEDFADKFNFLITVMVIMMCTSVVTVKQYMMKPISCYMATDIGGRNLLDYVENYCWVQGTIPIRFADQIPDNAQGWNAINDKKILYYQWVPFVLGLQCILFYLPSVIWRMICYNRTGTDVQHIVSSASQAVHSNEEQRAKLVMHLARTLEQLLFHDNKTDKKNKSKANTDDRELGINSEQRQNYRHSRKAKGILYKFWFKSSVLSSFRHQGIFIIVTYGFIKLLYIANSIGQLFLMQVFLGFEDKYHSFGYRVLANILSGRDWQATEVFPRVAFCSVPVKTMGTKMNYAAAQCVLPVNMLNEKIYIFLWWWFTLASAINISSTINWFISITTRKNSLEFIQKQLNLVMPTPLEKDKVDDFVHNFLRKDGVFIMRIITTNCGSLICSAILEKIWLLRYTPKKRDKATTIEEELIKKALELQKDVKS